MKVCVRQLGNRTDVVNARYVAIQMGYKSQEQMMRKVASYLGCEVSDKNHCVLMASVSKDDVLRALTA